MPAKKRIVKKSVKKPAKRISSSSGKITRTKNLIKKIKEINSERDRIQGITTIRGSSRFSELSKERERLITDLKKEFPTKSTSEILAKTKLETALEKKIREGGAKPLSELRKVKRPTFSDAKKELLAKNNISEKSYKQMRQTYLGMFNGREMNFDQRSIFADRFAKKVNIPFSKAMKFVNFAQRYSGMFKVRK